MSTTLALNYALGRTSPRGYRAFNLAVHIPVRDHRKGQSEIQLGHLDLARASLERAAALNPNDPETRASLAHIRALTER